MRLIHIAPGPAAFPNFSGSIFAAGNSQPLAGEIVAEEEMVANADCDASIENLS